MILDKNHFMIVGAMNVSYIVACFDVPYGTISSIDSLDVSAYTSKHIDTKMAWGEKYGLKG